MPKTYTPAEDEMDQGMYGGSPSAPSSEEVSSGDEEGSESVDAENAEESTALISNKILSPDGEPLKEGDEVVLQVVKNYGDESEVKYAPKKGGEGEGETTPTDSTESEIAALDTGEE